MQATALGPTYLGKVEHASNLSVFFTSQAATKYKYLRDMEICMLVRSIDTRAHT